MGGYIAHTTSFPPTGWVHEKKGDPSMLDIIQAAQLSLLYYICEGKPMLMLHTLIAAPVRNRRALLLPARDVPYNVHTCGIALEDLQGLLQRSSWPFRSSVLRHFIMLITDDFTVQWIKTLQEDRVTQIIGDAVLPAFLTCPAVALEGLLDKMNSSADVSACYD